MDEEIMYQVIIRCNVTSRDYPSVLIFKDKKKAEAYKIEYGEAMIKESLFRTVEDFETRIENLKVII